MIKDSLAVDTPDEKDLIEKKDNEVNTALITEVASPEPKQQNKEEYMINLHGEKVKIDEDDYDEFTPIKAGQNRARSSTGKRHVFMTSQDSFADTLRTSVQLNYHKDNLHSKVKSI